MGLLEKMKQAENIFTFDDFVELYQTSSKTITSIVLEYTDFYKFSGKRTKMPLFGKVCEVKFSMGSRTMIYKDDFDDPYTDVDFLKATFDVTGQFLSKTADRTTWHSQIQEDGNT